MSSETRRATILAVSTTAFCCLALLCCLVPSALAQQSQTGAISTFLDPSIEDSGMGRASVAVFWEEDLNDWSNPALLGYQRGIRYSYGKTRLVPSLAADVVFRSDRIAVGACGIGVSFAGKPFRALGRLRLDYGVSNATNENGDVIGTFSSYEDVRQIGVGVSVVELLESVVNETGGKRSHLSRYGDLSVGHNWKHVLVDLAPASVTLDQLSGRGEANQRDRGALLRVTPVGAMGGPVKLDLSGGYSQRNYDEVTIRYIAVDQSDPIVEERLAGAAARLSYTLPHQPGAIWDFLVPTVNAAATQEEAKYYWNGRRLSGYVRRTGQEISLLGLVSLRHGFVDDPTGEIVNDTWGYGIGLQYRGIASVRYDWAEVPEAEVTGSFRLPDVHRWGIIVSIDPYRLLRPERSERGVVAAR
jgi:hypothetical protein